MNVLLGHKLPNGVMISDAIAENIATLGENIKLTRIKYLFLRGSGIVQYYIHNTVGGSATCGKIGVAVKIDSDKPIKIVVKLKVLNQSRLVYIAATNPESLDIAKSWIKNRIEKENLF